MAFFDGPKKTWDLNIEFFLGSLDTENGSRGCQAGMKHKKIDKSSRLKSTNFYLLSIRKKTTTYKQKNLQHSAMNLFNHGESPPPKLVFMVAVILTKMNQI